MNKKTLLFISIFLIISILIICCSVNSNTGIIRIENTSDIPMSNVKVGSTLIALYLAPGAVYDYWTYSPLKGVVYADGFNDNNGTEVEFGLNQWGRIWPIKINDEWTIGGNSRDHPYD